MKANYSTQRLADPWFNVFKDEVSKGSDLVDDGPFIEAEQKLMDADPAYNREDVDEATGMYSIIEKIKEEQGDYQKMLLEILYKKIYGPSKN
jgi:ClpP class serine protease